MRHRLGKVDEIPEGSGAAFDVGDKRVAVFRHEGQWFALDETCPHRGGPLHEGPVKDGIVYCPWHQWQFELTSGCSPLNPLSKVATYAVHVEDDVLFVEI